ncbi:MAG: hypothetical protein FJX55_03715 [Alphaproteobacteria bacterium]|nr:hypothetical protein [Alphaproteobacteria bacterium]
MTLSRRGFTTLLLGGALAACSSPPPRARFPELTYGHLGVFTFDVERVEIVSEYKANLGAPNVEHMFPTSPETTLRRWAQDRLAATGMPGRYARFVIQDAKVTEAELPRTQGIRGAFTTDQAQRYDGALSVLLEIREQRGNFRAGTASAWASRSRTVPEGITINDREKVWFDLLEAMMNELNAEMDRQIRASLTQFLVIR